MLTDFRNSFNVGFCNKCATRFLYFPPHLKHVTTLPCETSAAGFQQVTNDVRGRDEVRENELDIRRCCGKYVRFLLFFDLLYFIKHSPKLCLKIELHVFLPRHAMHKRGLCGHAVSVCPSVCPSRSWITSKRINISSKFFHH